ncbi:MAG: succinylglutamate desuccinylase/aspartoacylase family protein [Chlamydiales bacterium]|nr:succinylglutamate desuccinylase/aspartoacylase family protein [Chlamydiales bacterium]
MFGNSKSKNKAIKICDKMVHPGESANLALPLPEQYSCAPLYMPIKVIHGLKEGPCLVIFSILRGTELNGLEIANRIIKTIRPEKISGTVIAIPVVNVYGLTHYPSTLPSGGDLAACFPGNENGSFGERMAYLLTHEIFRRADYCIELQTGGLNHNILPQVYCNFDNARTKELAKAFQSPVVTNVTLEGNHLRQTTEELQVPLLVYQAGEAKRFDENGISLGVSGIKNVMRAIDMLSKEPVTEVNPIFSRDEDWIIAHKGGILHPSVTLGQTIEKNEIIGTISDPFGADIIEPIPSPQKGIVVGINTSPLVYEGLQLFKVASFLDYDKAENAIEEWDKKQPDSYIG